jgi:hypothetical protein
VRLVISQEPGERVSERGHDPGMHDLTVRPGESHPKRARPPTGVAGAPALEDAALVDGEQVIVRLGKQETPGAADDRLRPAAHDLTGRGVDVPDYPAAGARDHDAYLEVVNQTLGEFHGSL